MDKTTEGRPEKENSEKETEAIKNQGGRSEVAILRDGSTLAIGDEVTSNYRGCKGYTFIVCEINPYDGCESKTRVVVHLKEDPSRKILGFKKDGYHLNGPDGIDANWFTKVL